VLDDRPYMRETAYNSGMPWTYRLMIANGVVFLLQFLLRSPFIENLLALSPYGLLHGFVWQLFTFQFLHGGFMHLLLNMVGVFFFGRAIEDALGSKRMLQLYFSSGVLGGLCQTLAQVVGYLVLGERHALGTPVVGASAGVFGLIAAFATMFPHQRITLLLFYVIPVSLPARWLLWGSIGVGLFGVAFSRGSVAHAAHLGGILGGILFIRTIIEGRFSLPRFRFSMKPSRGPKVKIMPGGKPASSNSAAESDQFPIDFIEKEVNPILEKISAKGIQSLTDRERKILEAARNRMRKP
jgi:membrane associated rhomboid family serine protease